MQGLTFKPFDPVVLTRDLPQHRLKQGDVGAIIDVHEPGALDVEFVTASGKTVALITVLAVDVRAPIGGEMLAVRSASTRT